MSNVFKTLIFFTLFFCLGFTVNIYILQPAKREMEVHREKYEGAESRVSNDEKASRAKVEMERRVERIRVSVLSIEESLRGESKMHNVLEEVAVLAKECGLKPDKIQMVEKKSGPNEKDSRWAESEVTMELSGEFNSFYTFLIELENMRKLMKVSGLKLLKDKKKDGHVQANIKVSFFSEIQQANNEELKTGIASG